MSNRPTALERAFELARSGDYETVDAIRSRLRREWYDDVVRGRTLRAQLRVIIAEARSAKEQPGHLRLTGDCRLGRRRASSLHGRARETPGLTGGRPG
jgi:Holliday junction resolvasome RuvABC ATP-dependent DNA helicase subunit